MKQLMISHLAKAAVLACVAATCAGCVVWHTEEIVLIEPSYSHLRDGAAQDDAADRPPTVQAFGKRADR